MAAAVSIVARRTRNEVVLSALASPAKGLVVLLHGILAGLRDMRPLAQAFSQAGYDTLNVAYPSTAAPIADLAVAVDAVVRQHHDGARPLHVVTHSMGGIVLRHLLVRRRPEGLGRIVMIAPPNGGSEVADLLVRLPLHRLLLGPAARELTTGAAAGTPPLDAAVGVIAGTASLNPLSRLMFSGGDDGCVAVERARLSAEGPLARVHAPHPVIMRDPRTIRLALRFVEDGAFS